METPHRQQVSEWIEESTRRGAFPIAMHEGAHFFNNFGIEELAIAAMLEEDENDVLSHYQASLRGMTDPTVLADTLTNP